MLNLCNNMPIVKRSTQNVLPDNELIKLKRQARFYKVVLTRFFNMSAMICLILLVYFYRHTIHDLFIETQESYDVLYQKASKISNIFGDWCNKSIDSVEIGGLKYIDKQEIVSAMYTINSTGALQMRSSVADMYSQVLKIPIIDSVVIKRFLWSNKMFISVKEKNIIATVKNKLTGKISLLDDKGINIDYSATAKFTNLPTVEDSEHPEKLIPLYEYLKDKNIYDKIYSFAMVSERRWNIYFKNNLLIKLPPKEWKSSIDILLHIDEKMNLFSKENNMVYIDLRIPGKIFLK